MLFCCIIDDTVHSGYATRLHTTISCRTITDTDNTDVVYGISFHTWCRVQYRSISMAEALEDCDTSSVSSEESCTFEDFYCEEIVEEDGESEVILMRRPSDSAGKIAVSVCSDSL